VFTEVFIKRSKYGCQSNHTLQDFTGLEIQISMKASKTESWFETGFQRPKTGLSKKTGINVPAQDVPKQRDK